jgi:LysR family transcriptional regulator, cyn operon transcriptional activator
MILRHIRYLLAVAEQGSFTRAAELLHVSQPTLSQQIRQLEDALEAQLLDRSGRTVRLTDSGKAYVEYARRALRELEAGQRAIHDVHALTRGSLRIGATPTFTAYLIGPLLEEFNRLFPNITLDFSEMAQDRMEAKLSEDALDVGIAFSETYLADIEAHDLFVESLAVIVGPSHPHAKRRTALTLDQLNAEKLILLNQEFATRHYLDRYFREHEAEPRIMMEVNSISAVIELVRRSALATLLPAAVAREDSALTVIALRPALPERTAALLLRKGAYQSAALRAFMSVACNVTKGLGEI